MKSSKYLSLVVAALTGCHIIAPYDPDKQDSSAITGDAPPPGDIKYDGLKLEGPVATLDGGGCSAGILHSDFSTKPPGWLPSYHCGQHSESFGDCGTPCWSASNTYLNKTFSSSSIKKFTLGLRFKMVKAPTCDVVLFRLGTLLGPTSELDYGIRLMIGKSDNGNPELQVRTTGKINLGATGIRLAQLSESTWYSVELRGRAYGYYQIYLLDVAVTGDDKTNKQWSSWVSYQYFYTLKSYQFGALTKDCCKPLIDFDWVCFMDRY